MAYIVIEIQTDAEGRVSTITSAHDDWHEAASKYHAILTAAAVSALPSHAATILASDGSYMRSECYQHEEPAEGA